MPMTIQAVYSGGVLRPVQPLALEEGETVDVTVAQRKPLKSSMRPATPEEEDYARRIRATTTLEEMYDVMATAPQLPEDYDIVQAMNESRRLTGFRMPDPEPAEGTPQ